MNTSRPQVVSLLAPWALLAGSMVIAGCSREGPPDDDRQAPPVFQRLAADGSPYEQGVGEAEARWACVRDTRTGLVWEVKTSGDGLHAADHTYSWYSRHPDHETDPGVVDGGQCTGSACDTWSFAQTVAAERLCGYSDWRVPGREELGTLVARDAAKRGAAIERAYFPHTQAAEYWSFTAYTFYEGTAWAWNFALGYDRVDWKREPKHVRLVRGSASTAAP